MIIVAITMIFMMTNITNVKAASRCTVSVGGAKKISKKIFKKAKKVKVLSSNARVCKVKYLKKSKKVKLIGKKAGKAKITIKVKRKGKKVKKYKYKVTVRSKKVTKEQNCKNALKKLNSYRKAVGADGLEWSDVLYGACMYRLKNSGFDRHKNIIDDLSVYFGGFFSTVKDDEINYFTGENQGYGYANLDKAMLGWRNSEGHYKNMIDKSHKSCAIAYLNGTYITIFSDKTASELKQWREDIDSGKIASVTLREKDGSSDEYIEGRNIQFYDIADKWNTLRTVRIKNVSGVNFHLEVGHTYMFIDKEISTEEGKVDRVSITVSGDQENIIELVS